jgi:hypothetical protein
MNIEKEVIMKNFIVQEEYTEYLKGVRLIMVEAKSEQDVLDGDYDFIDVLDEFDADGETQETNIITEVQYLKNGWTTAVIECDEKGVPKE